MCNALYASIRPFWHTVCSAPGRSRVLLSQPEPVRVFFLILSADGARMSSTRYSSTLFASANRLARRLRIPSILTCHGLGFSHPKYQEDLRGASHVIAIGPKVAQEIRHICPKLTVIPNGVSTEYYVPPQGSFLRNQVVYIARMDRGQDSGPHSLDPDYERHLPPSAHGRCRLGPQDSRHRLSPLNSRSASHSARGSMEIGAAGGRTAQRSF